MGDLFGIGSAVGSIASSAINSATQAGIASQNLEWQKHVDTENLALAKAAAEWQKQTDERNFNYTAGIDQRNFDYMAATQQTEWNRQDTAHQREVDDLMKAGLSPLAATGGLGSGTVVSQGSAPSMSTPSPVVPQHSVVPQIDGAGISSSLADMAMQLGNVSERAIREKIATADRISSERTAEKGFANAIAIVDKQIGQQNKEFVSNLEHEQAKLSEIVRSSKANEAIAKQANLLRQHESIASSVESITGCQSYYIFKGSTEDCFKAQCDWATRYWTAAEKELEKLGASAKSYSGNASFGKGDGSSSSTSTGKKGWFNSLGESIFGNFNFSLGGNYSDSHDYSEQFYEWRRNYCAKDPYPWHMSLE